MASVFLYHVVGDLTVAKPELVEFVETETVESAIRAIGDSTESGIPVWRRKSIKSIGVENAEMRQQRFLGILNSLDIVGFLARESCLQDHEKALKTPVSEIVVPNNSLLREVDPATRLIDALEMMKQGVKRLLVPKSVQWKGMSKKFSILYNGRWLKNINAGNQVNGVPSSSQPSSSAPIRKFCCLSREDVIRFLIGCLGALAPIPLSPISSLGAINQDYSIVEASVPAVEAIGNLPHDPSAIAVVEPTPDGEYRIIGEISACKLWRCDYISAAFALFNLSAGQFVMGVDDNAANRSDPEDEVNSAAGNDTFANNGVSSTKAKRFSSRSIGFMGSSLGPNRGSHRTVYRGRSAPLTCKVTSSLAAVMAQMLSHRATHVWVTGQDDDDVLVGVVGYADILHAVTRQPLSISFPT
ncbi:CBS domain-containing protein [Drosera capensis]